MCWKSGNLYNPLNYHEEYKPCRKEQMASQERFIQFIIIARKRSLGQGKIFTGVCPQRECLVPCSFSGWGGGGGGVCGWYAPYWNAFLLNLTFVFYMNRCLQDVPLWRNNQSKPQKTSKKHQINLRLERAPAFNESVLLAQTRSSSLCIFSFVTSGGWRQCNLVFFFQNEQIFV